MRCFDITTYLPPTEPTDFDQFSPEVRAMKELFCKTKASRCVFPFNHDGETYHKCAPDDDGDGPWCATATDDDGDVLDGFWGRCDVQECDRDGEGEEPKESA